VRIAHKNILNFMFKLIVKHVQGTVSRKGGYKPLLFKWFPISVPKTTMYLPY